MSAAETMPIAFIGFSAIAGLSWFFSYRPRLFVRVFLPQDELWGAGRRILRDPNFGRSTRAIALLQFIVATIFGVIGLWLRNA
jgi:hypothetical protein